MIRALVTDIEGTTTSLSFVKDVLFPYSRERLADFVRDHGHDPEIAAMLERLSAETGVIGTEALVQLLLRYIDEDRKDPVLKALQGRIWRDGYHAGAFVAHVYADVPPALRRWKSSGILLYVFSSGSIEAQQLLFAHTGAGDLTGLFSGFFDTTTGKKTDASSYRAIAGAIGHAPPQIAFLSDTRGELDAARDAGFVTFAVARDGTAGEAAHPRVASFDELGALAAFDG